MPRPRGPHDILDRPSTRRRFRGDFGTGKTRALLTIGSLCYKPFFASGASTVSPIFHIQDAFQGTLILDEADFRISDATAQLAKVLNNGTTRGMPVLRTMANRNRELNPQAFRVFGPKIIGMREHFPDLSLESRFLSTETNGRSVRSDVPIHLPESFRREARDIRSAILAWRFRSRFSIGPDPSRAARGVAPRYRHTSLALLSLVDDAELWDLIGRELADEFFKSAPTPSKPQSSATHCSCDDAPQTPRGVVHCTRVT